MKHVKTFKEFLTESVDYSNYITAIIALFYNDRVLILQRGSTAPWEPNKWSLVGGGVDKGETPLEAVKREVFEEVGLKPTNIKFIKELKTNDIGTIVYYIGDLVSDEVELDYENSHYKFINKEEIDNFEFVPYIKDFIIDLF